MAFFKISTMVVAFASCMMLAKAYESHIVTFDNKCGFGTPILLTDDKVLSTGDPVFVHGPLRSAIGYLQTGNCTVDGDECTVVKTTLKNPSILGGESNTYISLIPPKAFSVPTGFRYFNGCDGAGADCGSADCTTAVHQPDDGFAKISCQADNVNLAITFCE